MSTSPVKLYTTWMKTVHATHSHGVRSLLRLYGIPVGITTLTRTLLDIWNIITEKLSANTVSWKSLYRSWSFSQPTTLSSVLFHEGLQGPNNDQVILHFRFRMRQTEAISVSWKNDERHKRYSCCDTQTSQMHSYHSRRSNDCASN
jgi:hypothetical protein